jgi:hypothetical protein
LNPFPPGRARVLMGFDGHKQRAFGHVWSGADESDCRELQPF